MYIGAAQQTIVRLALNNTNPLRCAMANQGEWLLFCFSEDSVCVCNLSHGFTPGHGYAWLAFSIMCTMLVIANLKNKSWIVAHPGH